MNYPLPPSITDLSRHFCQEMTSKGLQYTTEVEYYFHRPARDNKTTSPWLVKFMNSPTKDFGKVLIFHADERVQEAKGVVAMASAMECADHWDRTGYVPKFTGKCLADLPEGSRFSQHEAIKIKPARKRREDKPAKAPKPPKAARTPRAPKTKTPA